MQVVDLISFRNVFMLWAFSSLVLLLLIYLVRPRPKVKTIPSLMFFFKDAKAKQKSAFLQKVLRNILFIIQFLAVGLLALASTAPFIELSANASSQHTILIIDASASTKATDGETSRFDKQIEIAKGYVGDKTSIVLAENFPVVLLSEGDRGSALQILGSIKPKDTSTNLGDAVQSTKEILEGDFGLVVVISDFLYNTGSDLMVAKKAMENEGIPVILESVEGGEKNIAITNVKIDKQKTQVFVRNYESEIISVKVSHLQDGNLINGSLLELEPLVTDSVIFSSVPGRSTVSIDYNDDLELDNQAYIFSPLKPKLNILVITNNEDQNLLLALSIMDDVSYTVAEPPIIPPINEYDVVILNKIRRELILPGTFEDIKNKVTEGGGLLIMAQDDSNQFDLLGMMPVTLQGIKEQTDVEISLENELTKDIGFSPIKKYFWATPEEGSLTYAESADGQPLLSQKNVGQGISFYYGLFDEDSDFRLSTSYPIFFNRLIHMIGERKNAEDFNLNTGTLLDVPNQQVKTPSTSFAGDRVYFDEAGFYEIGDATIAANLFDPTESNIKVFIKPDLRAQLEAQKSEKETKKEIYLEMLVLIAVIVVLVGEMLFIRHRGDI